MRTRVVPLRSHVDPRQSAQLYRGGGDGGGRWGLRGGLGALVGNNNLHFQNKDLYNKAAEEAVYAPHLSSAHFEPFVWQDIVDMAPDKDEGTI